MAIEFQQQANKQKSANNSLLTKSISLSRRVSSQDRQFFTEQLALLLETGSTLHSALVLLQQQMKNPLMRDLVSQMTDDIAEGKSFSWVLAQHPKVFSRTYVNLIAASEGGGYMHEVLQEILDMEAKRERFQSTLVSALTYPVFLLVFAFAVVIFVLVVVFPKFGDMFVSIQDELPATTVFFMAASNFISQQWALILLVSVLAITGLYLWLKSDNGRYVTDRLKLQLPGLSSIFTKVYMVQMLRVMSLSLKNGVGIMDTLHASREVVNNSVYERFILEVEKHVEEGGGVAAGFADSNYIPVIVKQMIQTGEEAGSLAKVMGSLADHFERDLSRRLESLSKLAEPLMLALMGAVVGILVSSLVLPIFKLSRAVG